MLNDEVSEGATEVKGLEYGVGVAGVAKLQEGLMRRRG
jgi:hypothetical protein